MIESEIYSLFRSFSHLICFKDLITSLKNLPNILRILLIQVLRHLIVINVKNRHANFRTLPPLELVCTIVYRSRRMRRKMYLQITHITSIVIRYPVIGWIFTSVLSPDFSRVSRGYVKATVKSGKLRRLELREKIFAIWCHFPPKSVSFITVIGGAENTIGGGRTQHWGAEGHPKSI